MGDRAQTTRIKIERKLFTLKQKLGALLRQGTDPRQQKQPVSSVHNQGTFQFALKTYIKVMIRKNEM